LILFKEFSQTPEVLEDEEAEPEMENGTPESAKHEAESPEELTDIQLEPVKRK